MADTESLEAPLTPLEGKELHFVDTMTRHKFIKKVFGILTAQMIVTVAGVAALRIDSPVKSYVQQHQIIFWFAAIGAVGCLVALACCPQIRHNKPTSYVCLTAFTVMQALMLGLMSSAFDTDVLLMATSVTGVLTLVLCVFAIQTKCDLTTIGGVLLVLLFALLLLGLLGVLWPSKLTTAICATVGAALFSVYLMYDVQLMLGGKHKLAISPDEYVVAALSVYVDIVNIFVYMLLLGNLCRS